MSSNLLTERSVRVNLPPSVPSSSSLPLPPLVPRLPHLMTPHSMVSVLELQPEGTLSSDQLQTVNSDLIATSSVMTADGSTVMTADSLMTTEDSLSEQLLNSTCHYQLQGTWTTGSGKNVNYIVLKEDLESKVDISKIYFNIEDISQCGGFDINMSGVTDRYHLNLLNVILEFPNSEIVADIFREFVGGLQPLASTEVAQPLTTPRIIEGKGPKIQLKMEKFRLDSEGEESDKDDIIDDDEDDDDELWKPEPEVKLEVDKKEIKLESSERKEKMTVDEKRFFEVCRSLGHKASRKDHYSNHFTNIKNESTCRYCCQVFSSESFDLDKCREECVADVVDHIMVQHFQTYAYKCELCGNTFNSKGPFHTHMQENHADQLRKFECPTCQSGFYFKKELKSHIRLAHEPNEKGLNLKCGQCDKTFSSKKTKYAHMRGIHGISSKNIKKEKPAVSMCPICGEKKKSEHNLGQHIKKFHENAFAEPIVCHLCTEIKQLRNRKYHTPYSYELHMRQIHSGGAEGKVVCEYCCKEFIGSIGKCKFALKEHIQAVHMGIRKACDECGKTFISNIVLNKHKKHVHRKEGAYPCKACGKIFRYSQQAIDHEYKDRGLAPYVCKQCPFKSADNWALAKHKKVCPGAPAVQSSVMPALNLTL